MLKEVLRKIRRFYAGKDTIGEFFLLCLDFIVKFLTGKDTKLRLKAKRCRWNKKYVSSDYIALKDVRLPLFG
jgi:hypothetical protein